MSEDILKNNNDEILGTNDLLTLSPNQYSQLNDYLDSSNDPVSESYKCASALKFSRELHMTFDEAYNNIDYLMQERTNILDPAKFDLNSYQAVVNSFKIGKATYKNNFLKREIERLEQLGEDVSDLEKEAFESDASLENLADYTDRNLAVRLLKGAAMSTTYTMNASLPAAILGGISLITPYFPGKTALIAVLSKGASAVINYENIQGQVYWDLTRGKGLDKQAARGLSKANAAVNSAIETALDSTLSKVTSAVTGGQVKSVLTKATLKMFEKGKIGGFGVGLSTYIADGLSEGVEEFAQSYVDEYTNYIADVMTEEGFDKTFIEVFKGNFKDACSAGLEGFGVALVMGAPFGLSNIKIDSKKGQAIKSVIDAAPTLDDARNAVSTILKEGQELTETEQNAINEFVDKNWYKVQDERASRVSAENAVATDTEAIKLTRQTRTEALQGVAEDKVEEVSTKHENAVRRAVNEKLPVNDEVLAEYKGKDWADKEIRYRQEYNNSGIREWIDANENTIAESKNFADFKKRINSNEMFEGDTDFMEWAYDKKKNEVMVSTSKAQFVNDYALTKEKLLNLKDEIQKYKQENDEGKVENYTGKWDNVDDRLFSLTEESTDEEVEAVRQDVMKNPQGYMDALSISQDQRLAESGQSTYKSQFMRAESKYNTDTDENIEEDTNPADELTDDELVNSSEYLDAQEELADIEAEIANLSDDEGVSITSDDIPYDELPDSLKKLRDRYTAAKAKKSKYEKKYNEAMAKLNSTRSELRSTYNKYKQAINNLFKAGERVRKLEAEHKQLTEEYKIAQKELSHARKQYNKLAKATLKNRIAKVVKWKQTAHDVSMIDELNAMRDYIIGRSMALDSSLRGYFGQFYDVLKDIPYDDLSLGEQKLIAEIATNINKIARDKLTEKKLDRMRPRYETSRSFALQDLGVELTADSTIGRQIAEALRELNLTAKDGIVQKIRNDVGKPKRLARVFDGNKEGVLTHQFELLHDCDSGCHAYTDKRIGSAINKIKELGVTSKGLHESLISFKNDYGKEVVVSVEDALGIYIYSQSPDFKKNIASTEGNGVGENIDTIINAIPDNYKAFADYMLDTIGERSAEIKEEYERTTNNPFVYREGKYFPAFAKDPDIQKQIDILSMEEFVPNAVADSFVKQITGKTYAMDLNVVSNYFKSIVKQERYLAYNSWVKDMNYYMSSNGGIGTIIKEKYGVDAYNTMWDFVKDVANPTKKLDAADQLLNTVLNNYSKAVLSGNILTVLKQIPSIATYFRGDIGASFIISENVRFFTDMKGTTDFVKQHSPIMAHRINSGYNFETSQFQDNSNPLQNKKVDKITNVLMKPISWADLAVTIPMWKAAYENEIAKGTDEVHAVRIADALIEDTQPTSGVRNLSKAQRDTTPYKRMLMMFTNQIMNSQNEIFFDIPYYWQNKNYKKAIQIGVSKLMAAAFMVAITTGAANIGEDDERKKKKFGAEAMKQLPTLLMPGWVGPQISSAMGGYGSYSTLSILSTSGNFLKSLVRSNEDGEKWQKIGDSTVNLALDALKVYGLPTNMGEKTFDFTKDAIMGESINQLISDII